MGAVQQKDAATYFTQALAGPTPPDTVAFVAKVKELAAKLCSGSELSGVAEPVAVAIVNAATGASTASSLSTSAARPSADGSIAVSQGQLRWLLQLCTRVLRGVVENPNEPVDASTPGVVHLTELLMRHVLRLTRGQSAVLIGICESGGAANFAAGQEAVQKTAAPADLGVGSPSGVSPLYEDAATQLCRICFAVLIHVPLSLPTVLLHLEVLRLLLTLTSSALHHSTELCEDTMDLFTELMMSFPQLQEFLDSLLKIIVGWEKSEWETQAPLLYHEGCAPSMRNFFQVFGGGSSGAAGGSKRQSVPYVLDVHASSVVLVGPADGAGGATGGSVGSLLAGAGGSSSVSGTGAANVATVLKDPAGVLLGSCSCWEQLGHHAVALLCVLIVHQKGGGRNPALEHIVSLQDGTPVDFVRLLSVIRWKLTRCPNLSILLYVLLHDHHGFLHTVLSQDAALLVSTVQQLLELTYKTCRDASRPALAGALSGGIKNNSNSNSSSSGNSTIVGEDVLQNAVLGRLVYQLRIFSYPFINFMSSTLLLLISQDCVVNRLLCNTPCLPGHMLERYDTNVPVGALAIVVLTLGIAKGFNERNEALIAVFAPCLVNLAPFVHDMDPYTAQRVSSLLTLVLRKIHRTSALLQAAAVVGDNTAGSSGSDEMFDAAGMKRSLSNSRVSVVASAEEAEALERILAMYLRQLRTVVEGIEALLRGANRHNEHLVYELLYVRCKIIDEVDAAVKAGFPLAAPTKQLLMNLTEMIKNCEADIASSDQAESPQEIIAILRRGQRQSSGIADGADGNDGANTNHPNSNNNNGGSQNNNNNNSSSIGGVEMTSMNGGSSGGGAASNAGALRSPGPDGTMTDGASIDLVYSYEESPHSYDFFGPFVWSILLSAARSPGGALWCHRSSELALFPH